MMKNILKFSKWIISEAIKTPHFEERREERLLNNPKILFPEIIINKFDENTLMEMESIAKEKIVAEFDRRIKKIEMEDFNPSIYTTIPLMRIFVSYMGNKYPLNLKVENEKNYFNEKMEYFGNQIYIPISLNTIRTIKIYKDDFTEDQIDFKNRWHFNNNPLIYSKKDRANLRYEITPIGKDFDDVLLATSSGTIRDFGEEQIVRGTDGSLGKSNKPHAYRLSPGREIKWKTKNPDWAFPGGFALGEIERVENDYIDTTGKEPKRKIKGERVLLSIIVKNPKGGPDFKTKKDFGLRDEIYLIPSGSEKFSRLEIVNPKFISPKETKDPIAINCKEAY